MEANELMIGDWVVRQDKPIQIQFIYNDGYDDNVAEVEELDSPNLYEIEPYLTKKEITIQEIEPIPLTSEILEKNGWIQNKYSTCENLYEYKGHHLHHAMIKRSNGRWVANVDGQIANFNCDYDHSYLRINIHYVHELQHALRLCGLTDLADNFRVD